VVDSNESTTSVDEPSSPIHSIIITHLISSHLNTYGPLQSTVQFSSDHVFLSGILYLSIFVFSCFYLRTFVAFINKIIVIVINIATMCESYLVRGSWHTGFQVLEVIGCWRDSRMTVE